MKTSTANLLSKDERSLIRATEPARLKKASEERLLELHARVRRGRNKYSKLHRRQGAAQVKADRSRGVASKKNLKTSQKAEIFETALGRVSDALAKESRKSAAAIKKERLTAASKAKKATQRANAKKRAAAAKKRAASKKAAGRKRAAAKGKANLKTPMSKKSRASAKSSGARGQAKRDKRR